MNDVLDWLSSYSGPVVALILVGAAFLFAAKLVVERGVDAAINARAEKGRLQLSRRSAFEERVLTDRYLVFQDLFSRVQRVTTTLNGIAHGKSPPDGFFEAFQHGVDVVPLTAIFEELSTKEPILGPRLHAALEQAAQAALGFARSNDDVASWLEARRGLLEAAEDEFGLSKIKWDKVSG